MRGYRFSLFLLCTIVVLAIVLFINCSPTTSSSSSATTYSIVAIPPTSFDLSSVPEAYQNYSPLPIAKEYVFDYKGFILEFDTSTRNATWVCYMLCRAQLGDGVERSSNFRMENRLGDLSPRDTEYRNSGYDRGHLAPAADMSFSSQSMYDSFYLTNVSPQLPSFNRGIWKQLEEQIRDFAIEKDTIWVVTGPVLKEGLVKMGNTNISVPELFYKVIYKPNNAGGGQGIAFLMRNEAGSNPLTSYAVNIDSVEALTNHNFFPLLSNQQERQIESTFDVDYWFSED
ncbi:DNA/RNA non-specific endonuclease [Fulvivirgaceae bacterium LMO-SS25]